MKKGYFTRIISLIMIAVILVGLVSCEKKKDNEPAFFSMRKARTS